MKCHSCLAIIDKDELISDNLFSGDETLYCPLCNMVVFYQECSVCESQYAIQYGDCPLCKINKKHKREEKQVKTTELSDILTPTSGMGVAYNALRSIYNSDKLMGRHRALAFTAKYMEFMKKMSTFFQDMEKALIPNGRNTPLQKLNCVEPYIEFAYAEGSLFEDMFFEPGNCNKNLDKTLRLNFVNSDLKNPDKDVYFYHQIDDDLSVNSQVLGHLLYLNAEAKPLFKKYIEEIQEKEKYPADRWQWLVKYSLPIIKRNIF